MSKAWVWVLLGGVATAFFLSVLGWQTQRTADTNFRAYWKDSSLRQGTLFHRLVRERSESLKRSYPFESFHQASLSGPFHLVAEMELSPRGDVLVKNLVRSSEWSLGQDETASVLSLLREKPYIQGTTYWFLREAGSGGPYRLMAFLEDSNWRESTLHGSFQLRPNHRRLWVAVLTSDPFSRVTDDFLGGAQEVALFDSLGQTLASSTRENSLAVEAKEVDETSSWQILETDMGLTYQSQVVGTNLTLVHRVPEESLEKASASVSKVFWGAGLGFLILVTSAFTFFTLWWNSKSQTLRQALRRQSEEESFEHPLKTSDGELYLLAEEIKVGLIQRSTSSQVNRGGNSESLTDDTLSSGGAGQTHSAAHVDIGADVAPVEQEQLRALLPFSDRLHQNLWSCLGSLQDLKGLSLSPVARSRVNDLESALRPLLEVNEQLRVHFKKEALPMERFEVGELLRKLLEMYSSKFQSLDVDLKLDLEGEWWVRGSKGSLRKAFCEILDNSLEAMREGDHRELSISCSRFEDMFRCVIEDTGCGLSRDEQDKIFRPLYSSKEDHLGLGLSFVQGVVAHMGGDVGVDSAPNKGLQISMTLPLSTGVADVLQKAQLAFGGAQEELAEAKEGAEPVELVPIDLKSVESKPENVDFAELSEGLIKVESEQEDIDAWVADVLTRNQDVTGLQGGHREARDIESIDIDDDDEGWSLTSVEEGASLSNNEEARIRVRRPRRKGLHP